jgi:hypothetical protein
MVYKNDPRTIMFINGPDGRVAASSPAGVIKARRAVTKLVEELTSEGYRCVHDLPFVLGEAEIQVRVFERELKPRLRN